MPASKYQSSDFFLAALNSFSDKLFCPLDFTSRSSSSARLATGPLTSSDYSEPLSSLQNASSMARSREIYSLFRLISSRTGSRRGR